MTDMMRSIIKKNVKILALLLLGLLPIAARGAEGVEWSAEAVTDAQGSGHVVITAKVAEGYHFYSFAPEGGYNSLEIKTEGNEAVTSTGSPSASVLRSRITKRVRARNCRRGAKMSASLCRSRLKKGKATRLRSA